MFLNVNHSGWYWEILVVGATVYVQKSWPKGNSICCLSTAYHNTSLVAHDIRQVCPRGLLGCDIHEWQKELLDNDDHVTKRDSSRKSLWGVCQQRFPSLTQIDAGNNGNWRSEHRDQDLLLWRRGCGSIIDWSIPGDQFFFLHHASHH